MRDFSATPALVTLAPRGAVRGFTLFVHGGRSNSVASGSRLQPPAPRMYSFLMGARRDGRGHGVAACQLRYGVRGYDEGDPVQDVEFYVSPFLTVDGRYRMSLSRPGERLSIQMELVQKGRRVFQASLTAHRRPMTAGGLAAMAVRHPLMTARVSALIRYQGVKLWLRGVPRVPRPRRSPQERVG